MLTGAPYTTPPRGAAASRTSLAEVRREQRGVRPVGERWVTARPQYSPRTRSPDGVGTPAAVSPVGSSTASASPSQVALTATSERLRHRAQHLTASDVDEAECPVADRAVRVEGHRRLGLVPGALDGGETRPHHMGHPHGADTGHPDQPSSARIAAAASSMTSRATGREKPHSTPA